MFAGDRLTWQACHGATLALGVIDALGLCNSLDRLQEDVLIIDLRHATDNDPLSRTKRGQMVIADCLVARIDDALAADVAATFRTSALAAPGQVRAMAVMRCLDHDNLAKLTVHRLEIANLQWQLYDPRPHRLSSRNIKTWLPEMVRRSMEDPLWMQTAAGEAFLRSKQTE